MILKEEKKGFQEQEGFVLYKSRGVVKRNKMQAVNKAQTGAVKPNNQKEVVKPDHNKTEVVKF